MTHPSLDMHCVASSQWHRNQGAHSAVSCSCCQSEHWFPFASCSRSVAAARARRPCFCSPALPASSWSTHHAWCASGCVLERRNETLCFRSVHVAISSSCASGTCKYEQAQQARSATHLEVCGVRELTLRQRQAQPLQVFMAPQTYFQKLLVLEDRLHHCRACCARCMQAALWLQAAPEGKHIHYNGRKL